MITKATMGRRGRDSRGWGTEFLAFSLRENALGPRDCSPLTGSSLHVFLVWLDAFVPFSLSFRVGCSRTRFLTIFLRSLHITLWTRAGQRKREERKTQVRNSVE